MTSKLQKIMDMCDYAVDVYINDHKSMYETVEEYLGGRALSICDEDLPPGVKKIMIEKDIVIHIQAYARLPGVFIHAFHYDLEACMDNIIGVLEEYG